MNTHHAPFTGPIAQLASLALVALSCGGEPDPVNDEFPGADEGDHGGDTGDTGDNAEDGDSSHDDTAGDHNDDDSGADTGGDDSGTGDDAGDDDDTSDDTGGEDDTGGDSGEDTGGDTGGDSGADDEDDTGGDADGDDDSGDDSDDDSGGDAGDDSGGDDGDDGDWPQCFAGDTMPDNPNLTVDPDATGYTTVISNNTYISMLIGPDRPACLTDEVANRDLEDLNAGLKHIVELVGFPAFPEWENGHYLNWVILNSGIPGATLDGEGGYQGNRWGHMNFESTQENPCTWDEYNRGAALHETIHALQSELWKYNNRGSGWIHEAHNTYMATMREYLAFDRYTMGYGAAGVLQASHVPIEAMGLLTDDTIGGPADQGAQGKQYVGGVYGVYRYGLEIFFMSLQLSMGRGFVNCLWIEAPENNQQSVFQVLESFVGIEGVQNAVMSFGARNALLDYGDWTQTIREMMESNWQAADRNWFYVFAQPDAEGWMSPPEKQIPHHEGRNTIPIRLESGATEVVVELEPDATGSMGTPEQLMAQLVYRTPDDEPVYGERFTDGEGRVSVPEGARNDLVSLVIAVVNPFDADNNAQYGYNLNEHFDYRVRIVSGGSLAPASTVPW